MFIKNRLDKNVPLSSHNGYAFSLPPGVCAIEDSAGEALLNIHKVESKPGVERHMTSTGIVELDNGHGIPALREAKREEWEKDGRKFAEVKRFVINFKQIPRKRLIKVAQERGISHERINEYIFDEQIDAEQIAKEINEMPIPEAVKRPVSLEETTEISGSGQLERFNQTPQDDKELRTSLYKQLKDKGIRFSYNAKTENLLKLLNAPVPQN